MSRLKRMLWNRCRLLLFAPFVVAVTALFFCGLGMTSAEAKTHGGMPKNSHDYYKIRDPKVDSKLTPAQRARVQRDAVIKKRISAKKYIHDVLEGKITTPSGKERGAQ